jgi:MSHA biogenesis protein MshO
VDLEYVPVLASGRYRAFASVSAEPTGNDPLEFNAVPPDTSFQVLGAPVDVVPGSALVIYNLGMSPADVYAGDNRRAPTSSGTALEHQLRARCSFPLIRPNGASSWSVPRSLLAVWTGSSPGTRVLGPPPSPRPVAAG